MHFSLALQVLGLVLAPVVLSTPLSERNSYTCQKDSLYDLFHKYGMSNTVEDFCCNYIHYPTHTVTVHTHPVQTVTHTVVATKDITTDKVLTQTKFATKTSTKLSTLVETSTIDVDVTSTTTSPATITETSSSTVVSEIDSTITSDITTTTLTTSTYETTTTATSSSITPERLRQRSNYPWNKGYNSKQLSSACSCLSLTKTSTKTITDHPSTYTKVVQVVKTSTATHLDTKAVTKTLSTTIVSTGTTTKDVSLTSSTVTTVLSTETDSATVTTTTSFTLSTTVTDTASTETDVTTTSTTSTTTPTCTPFVSPYFYLQVTSDGDDNGDYIQLAEYGNGDYRIAQLTSDFSAATLLSISDTQGHVSGESGVLTEFALQDGGSQDEPFFFGTAEQAAYNAEITCSITDSAFTCVDGSNNYFQTGNYNDASERVLALSTPGGTTVYIANMEDVTVNVVGVAGAPVPDFSPSDYFC